MANKDLFINREPSKPKLKRTLFDWSYNKHVSYKEGLVYPCYLQEVPSDTTVVIQPSFAFDFHPMVFPIQNNVRVHISYYKVPWRILWDNYEDWYSGIGNHPFPYIHRSPEYFKTGGLLDYLEVPTVIPKETRIGRTFTLNNGAKIGAFGVPSALDSLDYFELPSLGVLTDDPSRGLPCCLLSPVLADPLASDNLYMKLFRNSSTAFPNPATFYVFAAYRVSAATQSEAASWHFQKLDTITVTQNSNPPTAAHTGTYKAPTNYNSSNLAQYSNMTLLMGHDSTERLNDLISRYETCIMVCSNQIIAARVDDELPSHRDPMLVTNYGAVETGKTGTVTMVSLYKYSGFLPHIGYDAVITTTSDDEQNNFASINGNDPKIPISILPARAYEMIKNYVFNNPAITPFIKDGQPCYNKFLTNTGDGADMTTPLELFRAPYEYDKFTTCLKTPQLGHAPLVGISVNDVEDEVSMTFRPATGEEYTVGVEIGGDGNAIGISNYSEVADKPNIHRLEEFIAAGISINDLRQTSCYQRYLERMQNTNLLYKNVVQEFFGVVPPLGDHYPEYIGGVTRDVLVNKIQNVAKSEGNPLGDFAGTASVSGHSKNIEVFCKEQSYIIGLIWFSVTPVYSQMLPRHYTKFNKLDLYNPQFATIPPQPIYKYEINALALRDGHYQDIFGFNSPFVDLKTRQDTVHGEFRTNMFNFIQQRFFANAPDLTGDFIYMDPSQLADVFAVSSDTDKIYGIIHHDVLAEAPIPRISIPQIVG